MMLSNPARKALRTVASKPPFEAALNLFGLVRSYPLIPPAVLFSMRMHLFEYKSVQLNTSSL